jgi:hypothetical protein
MMERSLSIVLPKEHFLHGQAAGHHLFGGNVLAPRTTMTGPGSYDEALRDLNVTGLRYPGGSLTEYSFDIRNPDSPTATDSETGEETPWIPMSEFMSYAEANGHAVTIVLPTRSQLSDETDAGGDRLPEIDEEGLRDLIHDLASGVYGNAKISGFEIGNEYWGSGGMNAVEYGRLSSEMAKIIDSELRLVTDIYGVDTSEMSVLAQMGHNYGTSRLSDEYKGWKAEDIIEDLAERYPDAEIGKEHIWYGGGVNWTGINNELIKMSFDEDQEIDALDGIIAHVYTRGTDKSRQYDLDAIEDSWLKDVEFRDLEVHVTEWNLKSGTELDPEADYGLYQAHDMLNTMEEFMAAGVDQAHVWPLIQNTSNPLSVGFTYAEATAPGKMFAMMSENLPGKMMLDFRPGADRQTEFDADTLDLHAFAGPDEMVLYLASTSKESEFTDIDLSHYVAGFSEMEIKVLGVVPGQAVGNTRSAAEVETRDPAEVFQNGVLEADLDPGEIMQVVIKGLVPTEEFAPTMKMIGDILSGNYAPGSEPEGEDPLDASDAPDDAAESTPPAASSPPSDSSKEIPVRPHPADEAEDEAEDQGQGDDADDGSWGGLSFALALLPLLALLGMGM